MLLGVGLGITFFGSSYCRRDSARNCARIMTIVIAMHLLSRLTSTKPHPLDITNGPAFTITTIKTIDEVEDLL